MFEAPQYTSASPLATNMIAFWLFGAQKELASAFFHFFLQINWAFLSKGSDPLTRNNQTIFSWDYIPKKLLYGYNPLKLLPLKSYKTR